ncbi:uncharacterized protein At1g51745-like isoform X2 [Cucurbita moschata]|uniref:Uncharacterized protein At1g51745-like isoform X2 n=1 Tax=Cucurbita moschata TaxID=3662 RepID=A0A6J1GAK7_CUCMO|nr:uncharacterized protein At1g51745-like isoform X2 [Cucurbita moschata]
MDSFNGYNTSKAIDASVGGLVWVRRRNGSWWPGRIMGLEELSKNCLVSPKSGTPVKLLGREDASIDWYNLEKSKRVKAFRCGEYDEFIEKAKASVTVANKKAVKYARREDAILQALELESARLGKDQLAFSCRMDTSGSNHEICARISTPMGNSSEVDLTNNMNGSEDRSDSVPELSQSGISFEENFSHSMARYGQSRRTPNDSEDDGTEGVNQMRMRGLEDLGIGSVSKRKIQTGGMVELVREDTKVNCNLNTPNCLVNEHPPDDNKVCSSLSKRKRSLSNVNELSKRKNQHRPVTKVLKSTTMVSVPVVCCELSNLPLGGLSDGKLSKPESNESKKRSSAEMNNNSDSTIVSCENMTPTNALDASHFTIKVKDNEVSSVSDRAENDTSDQLFDVPFTEDGKIIAGMEHLGGFNMGSDQRVSSTIEERPPSNNNSSAEPEKLADGSDELDSNKCTSQDKVHTIIRKATKMKQLPDYGCAAPRLLPFRQSRLMVHSKYQRSESSFTKLSCNASLYEVELVAKTNYRLKHVQLVSLMSKISCKAVVGHPLTVEVLDNGHCDDLLSRPELDPHRVESPHSVQSNSSKGKTLGKRLARSFHSRPSLGRASKRKKSGQLSKKTRKLSSLTVQKQFAEESRPVEEKSKGSLIACVPLKVVFSRMNKGVNALAQPTYRPLTTTGSQ